MASHEVDVMHQTSSISQTRSSSPGKPSGPESSPVRQPRSRCHHTTYLVLGTMHQLHGVIGHNAHQLTVFHRRLSSSYTLPRCIASWCSAHRSVSGFTQSLHFMRGMTHGSHLVKTDIRIGERWNPLRATTRPQYRAEFDVTLGRKLFLLLKFPSLGTVRVIS